MGHGVNLFGGVVRTDRQAQDFFRQAGGDGKIGGGVAKMAISARAMGRNGIVNLGGDAVRGEMFAEGGAVGGAHDEEVPDRLRPLRHNRQHEIAHAGELGEVTRGEGAAAGVPRVEVAKFDREECGGELVEAGVEAGLVVVVALA